MLLNCPRAVQLLNCTEGGEEGGMGPEISLRSITRARGGGWALQIRVFAFGPCGLLYLK
jgi:hypothetical protein